MNTFYAERASREQRAINEAEYLEIARWLRYKYFYNVRGFNGSFPTWLIRQEMGYNNNKRVKGVYAALTEILGREADESTHEEQVEAQSQWDREQALIQLEGQVVMMALDFLYKRGTTSSLKVDQGGQ